MEKKGENNDTVLTIRGLKTYFFTSEGIIKAVDGVDLDVKRGQVMGIVGESGCGKSVTAYSILRLIQSPPGRIVEGEVNFLGKDLLKMKDSEMRNIRGKSISMIFQDPLTSLNPVLRIGFQLSEVFRRHRKMNKSDSLMESIKKLKETEFPSAEERVLNYPHELSGGMRQRAMIAMALSCEPTLLIADEPTTALDVTVQANVLQLMKKLHHSLGTAIILITHDMGVVANMCQRVAVMYAGNVVEEADAITLFKRPAHPYTEGLLQSLPRLGTKKERLASIKGRPPFLDSVFHNCRFEPRCEYAQDRCREEHPELEPIGEDRKVRCFYPLFKKVESGVIS